MKMFFIKSSAIASTSIKFLDNIEAVRFSMSDCGGLTHRTAVFAAGIVPLQKMIDEKRRIDAALGAWR